MTVDPIALQLWTVRNAFAANAERTIAAVRAAGFTAVELAPLPPGVTADGLAESLSRHEVTVTSIHCDLPTPDTIGPLTDLARACRCDKLIWHGWPRDPRFGSPAGVRDLIVVSDAAGALVRDHGLAFGIHNHWWEFEPRDGDRPIRYFHDLLHPDTFWQLDVYWARVAGADPAEVVTGLGPRLRSVHWKDGPCVPGEPMTALGEGKIDVRGILRALSRRVDAVIELDECATDALDAARRSRLYLESLATV